MFLRNSHATEAQQNRYFFHGNSLLQKLHREGVSEAVRVRVGHFGCIENLSESATPHVASGFHARGFGSGEQIFSMLQFHSADCIHDKWGQWHVDVSPTLLRV